MGENVTSSQVDSSLPNLKAARLRRVGIPLSFLAAVGLLAGACSDSKTIPGASTSSNPNRTTEALRPPTATRESLGRLASADISLADKESSPFSFNSHSGPFTLDIPSSWRAGRPDVPAYGGLHKNYQTYTGFQFLPSGVFPRLEDLKNYEEKDLNTDIEKYGKASGKSTSKAIVTREKVAGHDAYLISGVITNGSAIYRSNLEQSRNLVDVEVSMLVFMVGNQGYRFALFTHPEITQKELANFSRMMNSFR